MAAQQQAARFLAVGHLGGHAGRERQVGNDVGPEEGAHYIHMLRREPEGVPADLAARRSALGHQVTQPGAPVGDDSLVDSHQAQQGVVRFLGVARLGPGLFDHAGNRLQVEAAEIAGAFG